jgi:hypothetical protein
VLHQSPISAAVGELSDGLLLADSLARVAQI